MGQSSFGILSLIIFFPAFGALLLLAMPNKPQIIRLVAGVIAGASLLLSLGLVAQFRTDEIGFQFKESIDWMPSIGLNYVLGLDGISVWMVVLTSLLTCVAIALSTHEARNPRGFLAAILFLQTTVLGVFLSLDLVVFYSFFELSLIPVYFLMTGWGGPKARPAALKFFIYTFGGSIFMLGGIVALWMLQKQNTGIASFSIQTIQTQVANGELWAQAITWQPFVFWSFALAFLVKCPIFPFHTWQADTYEEAPPAATILIAGVLSKMGVYGLLRFCLPMFPDTIKDQVPILMGMAVISILYGAIAATVQKDMKRVLAFSSLSHMGFILLGIFSLTHKGVLGSTIQMFNHGITTGGLFLLVGILGARFGSTQLSEYGGLKARMPVFATLFLVILLGSLGVPFTNGFVGEFMALLGTFEAANVGAFGLGVLVPALAGFGVVLAAGYLLYLYQQIFYGEARTEMAARVKDIQVWEAVPAALIAGLVIYGGLQPGAFFKQMETSVQATRLMAVGAKGERPNWSNADQRVDETTGAILSNGIVVSEGKLGFMIPQASNAVGTETVTGE